MIGHVDHSHTVAQLLLYSTLEKSGLQGRLVDIRHLSELQARHDKFYRCFVGCMICQRGCSKNKDYLHNIEDGPIFSQEEAALLLKGLNINQLPVTLVDKLSRFDLVKFLDIFPRNLSVLLNHDRETGLGTDPDPL